jgi:hypothetical protein
VSSSIEHIDCVAGLESQHIQRVMRLFRAERRLLEIG